MKTIILLLCLIPSIAQAFDVEFQNVTGTNVTVFNDQGSPFVLPPGVTTLKELDFPFVQVALDGGTVQIDLLSDLRVRIDPASVVTIPVESKYHYAKLGFTLVCCFFITGIILNIVRGLGNGTPDV